MRRLVFATAIVLLTSSFALAAEKRPLAEIAIDAFVVDTQVTLPGAGDKHIAIAWWIPNEFWKSILDRDQSIAAAEKQALLDAMAGTSLLAVVQADINAVGAFNYYSKQEIERQMAIDFSDADGKQQKLAPMQNIHPNLQTVLGVFKPILTNAMGNLGSNMHFYVLPDRAATKRRLADPYGEGQFHIQLAKRDPTAAPMKAEIALPLNALYIPRKCPNGRDAHISWKYCPWTGKKLEE